VKSAVFVDTVHLLALINANDAWRAKALEWAARVSGPLVTTDAVLTEVADALCRSDRRAWAIAAIGDLRSDANVTCVPGSASLFARGLELYAERRDKDWSLTDCISFVVMRDRRIDQALTADLHFVQAGFKALLRD
jgi:uncharacterized protein